MSSQTFLKVQLIESRGFRAETHFITTKDGYILTVHRIINPYVKRRKNLKPILLFHGFQNSASVWLINTMGFLNNDGIYIENSNNNDNNTVGNTLGFVLAASGFDVWLINNRGNIYSMDHIFLDTRGLNNILFLFLFIYNILIYS